jgi:hypothetical protein
MNTNGFGGNGRLVLKEEVYHVVGCAMEVLNGLGHGLHEKPYENALVQQPRYDVVYKSVKVGDYVPDLIPFDQVVGGCEDC